MVVRDPSSNARWTVDAVLVADGLHAAPPLLEAATPRAALAEARRRRRAQSCSAGTSSPRPTSPPSRSRACAFPRSYVLVTPAYGESTGEVRELIERIREHIRIWLR